MPVKNSFFVSRKAGSESFRNVALAVHAGAGVLSKENITPTRDRQCQNVLKTALQKGLKALLSGATGVDAVEIAVKVLEDSPLFNAGKGAVLTIDGRIELDAAIMDGASRDAGAIASITTVKNPISAARAVMEKANHVLLMGKGAEKFAKQSGLTVVDAEYFKTPHRLQEWQRLREGGKSREQKFGTVGAVARDGRGNLAAATSTGGMMNKGHGRVGDSPIIGAGTYADNETCAVSCTGHGEYFIRYVVAYDIAAQMKYGGQTLTAAADGIINKILKKAGGDGGLIALDARGNCALPFNTEGMYRGCISVDGEVYTAIFR